jgi:hypothetical protein
MSQQQGSGDDMELSLVRPLAVEAMVEDAATIQLRGFSYEERRVILPAITEALSSGGCWLRERQMVSFSQVEFRFEMQLRWALETYSALIASGLELTQPSHAELTGLCTVRRHGRELRESPNRVLTLRLEVSFLEETEFDLALGGIGLA